MTARVLTSPLLTSLGVPHCFSTRVGGVSAGNFESLNLGNPSELPREQRDPPANIRENFRRILAAMGCAGRAIAEVHQVHGADVAWTSSPCAPPTPASPDPKADAILTDDPSRVVVIRVADCCPVLLAGEDGRLVGAVHAGWRGVVAGVLPSAIAALRQRGAEEIVGAIGPCIGQDHFEVGPEVAAEFRRVFEHRAGSILRPGRGDRWMIDLKEALRLQLLGAGVSRHDISPHCTFRDADLFYSHRRDRGLTGRTAGLIGPRAT